MKYLPAKQASEILGYHMDTLRRMADTGKIEVIGKGMTISEKLIL